MNNERIRLVDINKTFKTRRKIIVALENINISVRDKEFVAIVGPSGCGKSTIIRLIDDIIKPTSGEIYIDGVKHGKVVSRETVEKMGFIFQHPNLLPWLTTWQNVEFPLKVLKLDPPDKNERIERLLSMMNLLPFKDSMPAQLSQSMLQRIGVIRAMVHNPEILLMDEPFGQLDETMREQLNIELMDIVSKLGQTVIFITHNVSEAVLLADRVYIMGTNPGRIIKEVTVGFERPRTLEIQQDPKFVEYCNDIINTIGKVDLSKIK